MKKAFDCGVRPPCHSLVISPSKRLLYHGVAWACRPFGRESQPINPNNLHPMMHWIKSHPGQAAVVALSISLAISSVQLYRESTEALPRAREKVQTPEASSVVSADQSPVDRAISSAREPGMWPADPHKRLFASKAYVLVDGVLQRPDGGMFHPPVPNRWLMEHGLNPVDRDVLESDPDHDGFSTRLEWDGMDAVSHLDHERKAVLSDANTRLPADSTNPVDAASHPPYHTRLQLAKVEQIPFHLRFLGYDENPRDPKDVTVQINAVPGRTEFIEVGKSLKYAPFEVQSFSRKSAPGPDGTARDVSSIVVIDKRAQQPVTLVKGELANSPESYAILLYTWIDPRGNGPKSPTEIRVKNGQRFQLPPTKETYRVAGIEKDRVDIILPDGARYAVKAAVARQ